MNRSARAGRRASGALHIVVAVMAILAIMPAMSVPARAAGSATITIRSLLDDGSTPLSFARFQITDSNGTVYGPLETAPPDGTVSFTVDTVDDGTTFEIFEETPPACGITPDVVEVGPLAEGASETVDIQTSFASDCDLGAISIYSYVCPDGTDASATDYALFRNGCLQTVDGKVFQIAESGGGQSWNVVSGAFGISGRAPLVGLIPGDYKVNEQEQADSTETVVFCLAYNGTPGDAGDLPTVEQKEVGNDGVSLTLAGQRIACDFFTVPSSGDGGDEVTPEPTAEPTEEATVEPIEEPDGGVSEGEVDELGSIEVHLASCPAGYDAGNYFADCHGDGIEDVTVSVEGPDGFFDSMDTVILDTPGPGIASFIDLETGEYLISEDVPGDFVTYIVYCSRAESDEVVDFSYDDSSSEAIRLELTSGLNVVCDWYIIPDEQQVETGKITITKYTCDTGYSSDAYGDLSADCADKTDGVTFTLSSQSGGSDKDAVTGDSGTGRVRFRDLEPALYDVTEDVPGEFSQPVVWCHVVDGDWYQKEIANGGTTFDVEAGDDINCSWFNIPEDLSGGGSLRIHKSLCPAGLTSGYFENCYDTPLADVTFNVLGPGDFDQTKTTGNTGLVTFSDLNAGTYTVLETPPDSVNVAVYVVVCTRDGNNFPFDYDDIAGLRINLNLPAGADIVCDWYNVPPAKPQAGAGSITVIKSLCLGNKNNNYDWENDCENFGAGATFDLTRTSSNATVSGTTATNGKLVFSGLANGAYELDETSGDWCHAEADHVDANGNVLVQNGGNTNVYIYNCSKTVNELPNTGSGPKGGSTGIGGMMALWGAVSIVGIAMFRRIRSPQPFLATVRRID